VVEEWAEEEIEFLLVGDAVKASVAKADNLAFGVWGEGDFGRNGEGQTQAGACDGFSEAGVGLNADDDSVLVKGEFWVLDIGEAGGLGGSFEVVATVGSGKELLFEGALEGVAADAHFDGMGGGWIGQVQANY
jgi:hypothetical protein